jgi:hypothetical protein
VTKVQLGLKACLVLFLLQDHKARKVKPVQLVPQAPWVQPAQLDLKVQLELTVAIQHQVKVQRERTVFRN